MAVESNIVEITVPEGRVFLVWVEDGELMAQGVVGGRKLEPLPIGKFADGLVELELIAPYTDKAIAEAATMVINTITALLDPDEQR